MAAQKQEKQSSKNEKIHTTTEEKLKKTIKSKSEYTSRASPNGPLNRACKSKQMIIYPRSTFTHDFPYFR